MPRSFIIFIGFLSLLFNSSHAMAQQERSGSTQFELFCGANLGYADNNWLRLYDVQLNATPGFRWRLKNDWSLAGQGLIPVVSEGYTYRDIINKYWRFNMLSVSHQIHFNNANQHLKLSAGLFDRQRYGFDVKWAWPVNDWLMLDAQAGITCLWIMGTDFKGNYDVDFYGSSQFMGTVGANVYLYSHNIEFRLSGGKYIGNNYGSQLDLMRHFKHITLLAYAQLFIGKLTPNQYDNDTFRTNGGFKIIWMLPPYKKSNRKFVVRPASYLKLSNSAHGGLQSMHMYAVDPEENEREHPVDVNWGLRKEAHP